MLILRDYQESVLTDTLNSFRFGHKRPLVVLPCGGGKTVLFSSMAESSQAKGKTVWFLVHRRELLDQTIETFERFDISRETIHIGMVGTYANHLDRYPKPDFIIFDEAHHSSATTWQKVIDRFPDAYIVGLTATPCRLDGKPLGQTYDDLIVGVTARELIKLKYLAPYRYFAPSITDLSGLKRKGKDFDREQAAELLSERAVFGDVVEHYKTHADGLQAIAYCSTIKHSEATAEAFRAAGIRAEHLDGNTKPDERKRLIEEYRDGKIKILCNCELFGEGLDIQGCSCCMLLRPTQSLGLFIQQSMRCMRPAPGKTAIILDFVNNYERHGLPDEDRDWSLTETVKRRSQYSEDGALLVRQCEYCFYTFKSGPSVCPNCGEVVTKTREEIKNIKEIKLEEIKQGLRQRTDAAVADKSAEECKSLMELQAYARKRGYKSGWAWREAKRKGYVK